MPCNRIPANFSVKMRRFPGASVTTAAVALATCKTFRARYRFGAGADGTRIVAGTDQVVP